MNVVKNIFSLSVLQVVNYIVPLITFPYLVRVLGPENFGLLSFSQSFIQYFIIITEYGFNLSATQQIAMLQANREKITSVFIAVMTIKCGLMLLSLAAMSVIIFTFPKFTKDWLLYYITFLSVAGNVFFPVWFFQGIEQMKYITTITIITRIIAAILLFVVVHSPTDYLLAALIQTMGPVVGGVISLNLIKRNFLNTLSMPTKSELGKALQEGWHIFVSTAAVHIYTSSNLFFLGLLTDNVTVGYFSIADKLVKSVQGLISPVSQSIYPHINALIANSKTEARSYIRTCLLRLGSIFFVISAVLFLTAESLVRVLMGEKFYASVTLVQIMAFLPFITALSNILGVQTMLPFGMPKLFSRILVLAGVLNLMLIIPMVQLFSATGTAMTVVITECFVTLAMGFVLQRRGVKFLTKGA